MLSSTLLTARLRHVMLMLASLVLRGGCPNAGIPLAFSTVSCEPREIRRTALLSQGKLCKSNQRLPGCVTLCSFLKENVLAMGLKAKASL